MRKRFYVFLIISIAIMAVIFLFSAQNGSESSGVSQAVLDWILGTFGGILGAGMKAFLTAYIRKCAHFLIYLALGIFLTLTVREARIARYHRVISDSGEVLSHEAWNDMMSGQIFRGTRIGQAADRRDNTLVSMGLGRPSGYHWNASLDAFNDQYRYGSGIGITGALIALIICAVYACSDEIHQYFVAARSAQVTDVLLDSCGALAGIVIVWMICGIIGAVRERNL